MATAMQTNEFKRVLIADDHPIILIALTEMLDRAFGRGIVHLDTVADADTLFRRVVEDRWDCLILDLYMPGGLRGLPLLHAIREARPELRTIVYTSSDNPCLMQASLEEGVDGYISKANSPELVIDALSMVAAGNRFVDPMIDLRAAETHAWNKLTLGERSVLIELVNGRSLQEIAFSTDRSYKTVTAHKYNALRKLGLRSNSDLSQYFLQSGLGYLLD